jgi:hypothetical protein
VTDDRENWESPGLMIGVTPVGWFVLDKYAENTYGYKPHEVEHVTCESDAEQVTPNGALPR